MKVFEIYPSIQGETHMAGLPCTLVRFAGCDLRCSYCDTPQAFHGGTERSVDEIVADVARGPRLVLLTGGEPLLQRDLPLLARRLLEGGFEVMVETSGAHDVSVLPREAIKVVDVKTPGSGETHRMDWENLRRVEPQDAVKFVLCDEEDYAFARRTLHEFRLPGRVHVLLSPAWGRLDAKDLVTWMLRDRVPARLNVAIHKYLWGPEARGV